MPWEIDISEVTHEIHEHIIQEDNILWLTRLTKSIQILTHLVLDGGDLFELTRRLAEILNCSVTIEDASLRLLAHTSLEPTDQVRQRSIQLGRTPDDVIEWLKSQEIFEYLRKKSKPYHIPPYPPIGFTLERIVAPILVGSQLFGYIWIIASEKPLSGLEYLVIERGAVVAALILSQQEAIYETEQHLKTQLLESSLDPQSTTSIKNLSDTTWQNKLQKGYILVAINVEHIDSSSIRLLIPLLEEQLGLDEFPVTTIERGQLLVVVVGTMDGEKLRTTIEHFILKASNQGYLHLSRNKHLQHGCR